ncbi:MAG: hypothetical protein QM755_13275 [Luteolibacter sp.]
MLSVAVVSAVACNTTRGQTPYLALAAWGVCLLLLLILVRRSERRLRMEYLPPHGWVPWCFRIAMLVWLLGAMLVTVLVFFGQLLPGVYLSHQYGRMGWYADKPAGKDYSVHYTAGYTETLTPTWKRGILAEGQSEPVELRFHPRDQPLASGWIIRAGENLIRREQDGRTVPWNGQGVMEVLTDIAGKDLPVVTRDRIAAELDAHCVQWSSGRAFASGRSTNTIDIGERGEGSLPPMWLAWVVSGGVCGLLACGVGITAKLTMGDSDGKTENRPS